MSNVAADSAFLEALKTAALHIHQLIAQGEVEEEVINPFVNTAEQRRGVRRLLEGMHKDNVLGSAVTNSDVARMVSYLVGMGPLDPLLQDSSVISIQVNGHNDVLVFRGGVWERPEDVGWETPESLSAFAHVLASRTATALGPEQRVVQAQFASPAGRIQIDTQARTAAGVTLHIRLGRRQSITLEQMAAGGGMSAAMMEFLSEISSRDLGLLVIGKPATGKTTLLEAMITLWPDVPSVALDDASEFTPRHPLCVLYNVPADRLREGFIDALRKNTDRIAVAEVRGFEAVEMLRNSGALTAWTTLHADSAEKAMLRLIALVKGAPDSPYAGLNEDTLRRLVSATFPVIIQTDMVAVGGSTQFYISTIDILEDGRAFPLFRAETDGPLIKGFREVGNTKDVLARWRRRVWGRVSAPELNTIQDVAKVSPEAALSALAQYLRLHPGDKRGIELLRLFKRTYPLIKQSIQVRLSNRQHTEQSLIRDRDWEGLLAFWSQVESDPILTSILKDTGVNPVRIARTELARRVRANRAIEEALSLDDIRAGTLIGLYEAITKEPGIYPADALQRVAGRLKTWRAEEVV